MADKNKRQGKCKSDDHQKKKNTKGGASTLLTSSLGPMPSQKGNPLQGREKPRKRPPFVLSPQQQGKKTLSSIKNPHIVPPVLRSPYLPSQRHSVYAAQQRPNTHNPQQKKKNTSQTGLKQLQEYFHGLVLERMLVCNNACNEEDVEILSTSCGGQPPTIPNSVILDYECFEENDKTNKNECCKPPITANCKNLINLIKKLLTDILAEFFKSTSSPVMFDLTIAKVAKACVVSYLVDIIINGLDSKPNNGPDSKPNNVNSGLIKFYVKVSVQTITGSPVNTARDFFVYVNANSLKTLLNVPNINALTSNIVKNELKQNPEIIKKIKDVLKLIQVVPHFTLRN